MQAAQTPQQNTTIDLNARERFTREIHKGKYAGISYLDSITETVKGIETHNREFRDGKRGPRDAQRAKAHFEAAQLKTGEKRVLAFYLHLGTKGKQGTTAPHEITADAVLRTTGGPCAQRTFERHLASLCKRGWLSRPRVPTGTRVLNAAGKWVTLEVCKVTLTPAARLLIQKTHLSLPLPKRQTTEGDNPRGGEDGTFSPSVGSDKIDKMERRAPVVAGLAKESPSGDESTCPPSATGEQRALRSAPRKAAKSAAAVPGLSARKKRTSAPKTWRTARRTLLAELFAFFHADPQLGELYRVAELQTDPAYPAVFQVALDWDSIVRRWVQMGWADRRRCMKNEIAPPLRAWCSLVAPPEGVPQTEAERQHAELSQWLQVIPDILPASVPEMVAERMRRERDRINMLVRLIHSGRVSLDILSPDDHTLLNQAGFLLANCPE